MAHLDAPRVLRAGRGTASSSIRDAVARSINFVAGFLDRPVSAGAGMRIQELLLASWFGVLTLLTIVRPMFQGLANPLGWDAVVYTEAARALLAGGDPWHAQAFGITFAAPPPSLIPYIPLTVLPDVAIELLSMVLATVSAVYVLRKLHMPMWWLLFPPVGLGIVSGSSTLPMLALLVRGGVVAEALAVTVRVYAGAPLAALTRWRGLFVAAAMVAVSAPFLAWPTFIAEREHVADMLNRQADGGMSATAIPYLVPFAILFLLLLGRRRAAWLLVPALWPNAQLHYASLALPVLAEMPVLAVALSAFIPGLVVAGLAAQVAIERLVPRFPTRSTRRVSPDDLAARLDRAGAPAPVAPEALAPTAGR